MLKPAFQAACRAAIEALARETADGGPALLVGTPWVEDGKLYNAVCAARRRRDRRRCASRSICRTTACSTRSACSRRVRCRGRSASAACGSACRSARTSGAPEVVECLAETGAEILLVPNGSPYWRDKDDVRLNIAVARVDRERPAAGLRQPGRRPGRTGVRRRLVRRCMPTARSRSSFRHFARAVVDDALGSATAARWRCADGAGRAAVDDGDEADYAACVLGLRDYVDKNGFPGRGARPVRRHRFRAVRGDGGRCARRRARALRDAAVSLHRRRNRSTMRPRCAKALGVRYDIVPIAAAVEGLRSGAGAAVRRHSRATSPRRTCRRARAAPS